MQIKGCFKAHLKVTDSGEDILEKVLSWMQDEISTQEFVIISKPTAKVNIFTNDNFI
jgi:hypothetical protein